MDTEIKLKMWRGGQLAAERLAAHVLQLDGFLAVDPQCPLGGPDGLKDVICQKNGWKYIGAAYFPTTDRQFTEIKSKFDHDLKGVGKNNAQGIVFVTNQKLTLGERDVLTACADSQSCKCLIYHLERIRVLLDSPSGYGIRLEYLDVEMNREEQLSFFSQWNHTFRDLLREHTSLIIGAITGKIDTPRGPAERRNRDVYQLVAATNCRHAEHTWVWLCNS